MKKAIYSTMYIFFIFMCLTIPSNNSKDSMHLWSNNSINNKVFSYTPVDSNVKTTYPKEVFLTFDDGPCVNNTKKILKILKDNNVKASFFIVGMKGEENPQILKEISDSDMSLCIHTYCHDYKKVYKNLDAYLKDYEACSNVIKNVTGKKPAPYIRLPGGSDNLVTSKDNLQAIKQTLNSKGIRYVDWNVCSGDAVSHVVEVDKIKSNVMTQCKNKNLAVILMHDTYYKHFTVEALPDIIKYLKDEGFVFRTFNDLTPEEDQQMRNLKIINR